MSKRELGTRTFTFNIAEPKAEQIDEYWRKNLYYNKTEFIVKAIDNFMESVECPFCHARNPRGGRICSVCFRPLTLDDDVNVIVNVSDLRKQQIEED